jgi:hypothetical protein
MPTDKINGCGRANSNQLEFQNSVTNLSFLHYREGFLYKSLGGGGEFDSLSFGCLGDHLCLLLWLLSDFKLFVVVKLLSRL